MHHLALTLPLCRLSFGVIGRLPRVTPEPGAVFNGYAVPASVRLHDPTSCLPSSGCPADVGVDYCRNELVDDAPERERLPVAGEV